jgi:hypothetical protein
LDSARPETRVATNGSVGAIAPALAPGPAGSGKRGQGDYDPADVTKPAHIWIDRREIVDSEDDSSFDRVAFAMRALRLVKPPRMTVAVCEGRKTIWTDRGRNLRAGPDASWGIVSVPPHASRADIALAVAALAGKAGDPYVLDMILHHEPS